MHSQTPPHLKGEVRHGHSFHFARLRWGLGCPHLRPLPIRVDGAGLGIGSLDFELCFATSWLCGLRPVTFLWAAVSLPILPGRVDYLRFSR